MASPPLPACGCGRASRAVHPVMPRTARAALPHGTEAPRPSLSAPFQSTGSRLSIREHHVQDHRNEWHQRWWVGSRRDTPTRIDRWGGSEPRHPQALPPLRREGEAGRRRCALGPVRANPYQSSMPHLHVTYSQDGHEGTGVGCGTRNLYLPHDSRIVVILLSSLSWPSCHRTPWRSGGASHTLRT